MPVAPHLITMKLTLADVMTPQPITIGRDQPLAIAHKMMSENGIRHLPVLEHGDLVGVLSQRDLYFVETIPGVDRWKERVDDAMSSDARTFTPDVPLSVVAKEMKAAKLGCAVVVERGRVVGIFTATDALDLVAESGRDSCDVALHDDDREHRARRRFESRGSTPRRSS